MKWFQKAKIKRDKLGFKSYPKKWNWLVFVSGLLLPYRILLNLPFYNFDLKNLLWKEWTTDFENISFRYRKEGEQRKGVVRKR